MAGAGEKYVEAVNFYHSKCCIIEEWEERSVVTLNLYFVQIVISRVTSLNLLIL